MTCRQADVLVVLSIIFAANVGCYGRAAREVRSSGAEIVDYGNLVVAHSGVYFDARKARLTDGDFRRLFQSVRSLRPYDLGLEDAAVGNATVVLIARLDQLVNLYLDGTRVTEEGLQHLKPLPRLENVYLSASAFDAAAVARLETAMPGVEFHRRVKVGDEWSSELGQVRDGPRMGTDPRTP